MPHPRKSVSPKQLAANRANAAKSTGPVNSQELFAIERIALTQQAIRRAVGEFERLKALRQEFPAEPISHPQSEPKETTCTP